MLYLYGIIDATDRCGAVPAGHDEATVTVFPEGGLAAAVSEVGRPAITPSAENVWRHEKVLGALMERHAVLPMRFGTICDGDKLISLLRRRQQPLLEDLCRVRGTVEIALRISANPVGTSAVSCETPVVRDVDMPGTAYLRARRDLRQGVAIADVEEVRHGLTGLSVETLWEAADEPALPLKASFLIAKCGLGDFIAEAKALAARYPDLVISCTGPWAPYSFVGESVGADGEP